MKMKKLWGAIGVLLLTVCVSSCVQSKENEPTDSGNDGLHVHTLSSAVKENVTEPTCEKEGSYENVVYCSVCGEEISRTKETSALAPHQYEDEACLLCGTDGPHVHTLSSAVKENVTEPTCEKEGSYESVVYCSVCGEEISRTKETSALAPHQYEDGACLLCGNEKPSEGLIFTSNGNKTCSVSGIGSCVDARVVIPKVSPSGDTVTGIADNAFFQCEGMTSVHIPDTVKKIGESAFSHCTGLTEITIPDSVVAIQNGAFQECSGLISVTLPKNITYIADNLFKNCGELVNVEIPSRVTRIGAQAFQHCKSIEYIVIPASVKTIEQFAFMNCTDMERARFENAKDWYYCDPQTGALEGYLELSNEEMNALYLTFVRCEYRIQRR